MSQPTQNATPVAPRNVEALNVQWERQLLGRKSVEHEDEGFKALKVCSQ